ncbi:MAG: hypothetical protein IPN03_23070 [Holophagales bacterium]|nr:hypothetical protein [Holophagales bacterium]
MIDRIVQQAVAQVLSPYYEPTFHPSSHGFRPGRSCHTAIAEAKRHLEEGYEIVVDLDLDKFFDRVHWERLLARLGMLVKDHRLIELIGRMLKARVVMPDGVVVTTEEGTPQGGPLSPLLSNIVLDEPDWELETRTPLVRYADDQNIYVRSQRAGERVMANVRDFHRAQAPAEGEPGQERRGEIRGNGTSWGSGSGASLRTGPWRWTCRSVRKNAWTRRSAARRVGTGAVAVDDAAGTERVPKGWIGFFGS